MQFVHEGDTVVAHSVDQFARNLEGRRRIIQELIGRGIKIQFVKEGVTFSESENSPK